MFWDVLSKLEHFSGEIDLQEPEQEGEIVSTVKSVPECTNSECVGLVDLFVLEWCSFVDASSEPELRTHVPVCDLFS